MSSQIEELKSFIVAIVLKRNIQYKRFKWCPVYAM